MCNRHRAQQPFDRQLGQFAKYALLLVKAFPTVFVLQQDASNGGKEPSCGLWMQYETNKTIDAMPNTDKLTDSLVEHQLLKGGGPASAITSSGREARGRRSTNDLCNHSTTGAYSLSTSSAAESQWQDCSRGEAPQLRAPMGSSQHPNFSRSRSSPRTRNAGIVAARQKLDEELVSPNLQKGNCDTYVLLCTLERHLEDAARGRKRETLREQAVMNGSSR